MTTNESTLSRLLGTFGAMLRSAVPVQAPALAGAPAATLTDTAPRASFGGRKDEEHEPAWASFPRAL